MNYIYRYLLKYYVFWFTKWGCLFMNISFIDVLTKPLKLKTILILLLNLFLLFLPAILSAKFLGIENWVFKIVFAVALIILNGYFWTIFQHELEEDNDDFPKWHFINNFFIGLKGIVFLLASVAILALGLFFLWLLAQHVPTSENIAFIIAIVWSLYWLLMHNAVAMGIFSEKFNPVEAIKFPTIAEIITSCWLNYIIAGFYMVTYIFIISMVGWACVIFFGPASTNFVIVFFVVYAVIVYFLLYANVFSQIRTEFESHF